MSLDYSQVYTWPQVVVLSKHFCRELPPVAVLSTDYVLMAENSMGFREVELDGKEGESLSVMSFETEAGDVAWYGYEEAQLKDLYWGPTGYETHILHATKWSPNTWKLVFKDEEETPGGQGYLKTLWAIKGSRTPLEQCELKNALGHFGSSYADRTRYITETYNQLTKGIMQAPDDPFCFVACPQAKGFINARGGMAYLRKAWTNGILQAEKQLGRALG